MNEHFHGNPSNLSAAAAAAEFQWLHQQQQHHQNHGTNGNLPHATNSNMWQPHSIPSYLPPSRLGGSAAAELAAVAAVYNQQAVAQQQWQLQQNEQLGRQLNSSNKKEDIKEKDKTSNTERFAGEIENEEGQEQLQEVIDEELKEDEQQEEQLDVHNGENSDHQEQDTAQSNHLESVSQTDDSNEIIDEADSNANENLMEGEEVKSPKQKKQRTRRRSLAAAWEARIKELNDYKEYKGDCKVPKDYPENPSLAGWCDNQRRQRKLRAMGKQSSMTDEREDILNCMGFWWGFGYIKSFEERIDDLRKLRNGYLEKRAKGEDGSEKIENDVEEVEEGEQSLKASDNLDEGAGLIRKIMIGCQSKDASQEMKSLHEWIRHQTQRYHDGKLPLDRENILREVGMDFPAKVPKKKWKDYYDMLLQYKEEHGDVNMVSARYGGPEEEELYRWVQRQRSDFGAGVDPTRSGLSSERISMLSSVGFLFNKWELMYQLLVAYKENHGHCNPPKCNLHCIPKDDPHKKLKDWVALQRYNFRRWKNGVVRIRDTGTMLTNDRIASLLKLGFDFDPKSTIPEKTPENDALLWKTRLAELVAYKELFGNCDVPAEFKLNKLLSKWVRDQRSQYKITTEVGSLGLSDEKVDQLKEVGFIFSSEQAKWENMIKQLKAFCDEHGHADVPGKSQVNTPLSRWAEKQRNEHSLLIQGSDSSLTEERKDQLEEIGFKFLGWDHYYRLLCAYKDKYGTTDVSILGEVDKEEFGGLAGWVDSVREKREENGPFSKKSPAKTSSSKSLNLSFQRTLWLKKIGFRWHPWKKYYEELAAFVKKKGHFDVPKSNRELVLWIGEQREMHENSENFVEKGIASPLTGDHVMMLEDIDFRWKEEPKDEKEEVIVESKRTTPSRDAKRKNATPNIDSVKSAKITSPKGSKKTPKKIKVEIDESDKGKNKTPLKKHKCAQV